MQIIWNVLMLLKKWNKENAERAFNPMQSPFPPNPYSLCIYCYDILQFSINILFNKKHENYNPKSDKAMSVNHFICNTWMAPSPPVAQFLFLFASKSKKIKLIFSYYFCVHFFRSWRRVLIMAYFVHHQTAKPVNSWMKSDDLAIIHLMDQSAIWR